jgi:MFS superfamily sulfate permease-like transporter
MNRDLVAVGVGNLAAGMLGGLPMISEIVRSRANIDNGAKTRFANFWHGMFLLSCVALIPMFLHRIPTAALAAMLIYTGTRLAHPREFMNMFRVGSEQLAIFAITLVAVLATDLLIGICIGIVVKAIIHVSNGVSLVSLFKPDLTVVEDDGHTVKFEAYKSAVFSNWIPIRRKIERLGLVERKNVVIDFSNTKLVDHNVMVKLDELVSDFEERGLGFTVVGLEAHQPLANHAYAARKKGLATLKRLTIVADPNIERLLETDLIKLGATGYTSIPCYGIGKRQIDSGFLEPVKQVRIEIIATSPACDKMMDYLRTEIQPSHHITVAAEDVQVARVDAFVSGKPEKQAAPLVH